MSKTCSFSHCSVLGLLGLLSLSPECWDPRLAVLGSVYNVSEMNMHASHVYPCHFYCFCFETEFPYYASSATQYIYQPGLTLTEIHLPPHLLGLKTHTITRHISSLKGSLIAQAGLELTVY